MTRVCAVGEVPVGEARRFEIDGRWIAVANLGDEGFRAVDAVCSHEHAWLDKGEVDIDLCTIECPKHGSTFDLNTGKPRSLPAVVPVAVYPVTINDDDILIEVGDG